MTIFKKCKYFGRIAIDSSIHVKQLNSREQRVAFVYNQSDMDLNGACYGTDTESYLLNEVSWNRDETKMCCDVEVANWNLPTLLPLVFAVSRSVLCSMDSWGYGILCLHYYYRNGDTDVVH